MRREGKKAKGGMRRGEKWSKQEKETVKGERMKNGEDWKVNEKSREREERMTGGEKGGEEEMRVAGVKYEEHGKDRLRR